MNQIIGELKKIIHVQYLRQSKRLVGYVAVH
jgi:hypothetical protein